MACRRFATLVDLAEPEHTSAMDLAAGYRSRRFGEHRVHCDTAEANLATPEAGRSSDAARFAARTLVNFDVERDRLGCPASNSPQADRDATGGRVARIAVGGIGQSTGV
mgnify:CR=1 FL=1